MMTEKHTATKRTTKRRQNKRLLLGALALFFVFGSFNQYVRLLDLFGSTRNLDQVGAPLSASQILNNSTDHMEQILGDKQPPHRVIYSRLRKDQAGWVIFDMLKAHAYAFAHNRIYGGACGDSIHKDDIQEVLKSVGWRDILPLKCPDESDNHSRIYSSTFFEKKHGRRMGSISWREFIKNHTDYSYFVGKESLNRDHVKELFSIVVHIRRRDVTPCCYPNWYLPNSYFSSMIDKYAGEQEPGRRVEVRIFSQSDSHESWDDFRRMNYTLNLDGPVGEVWRAILSADVFIGSISEFSRVPALFAKGTIPDPRNISDPAIAAESKARAQRLLEQCSEVQLAKCKHKWWMDPNSSFLKH